MKQNDILYSVIGELQRRTGELRQVAKETGLPYDTVLRIKNREGDPGYSKVKRLAEHFGISRRAKKRDTEPANGLEASHG